MEVAGLDKNEWRHTRTCGRVHRGPCNKCRKLTYFGSWRRDKVTLCHGCYEEKYEPEKAAARKKGIEEANKQRDEDLAKALKGELPGATITESGTVLGPPHQIYGMLCRQVLREGSYDVEGFKTDASAPPPALFSNYRSFEDKKNKPPGSPTSKNSGKVKRPK